MILWHGKQITRPTGWPGPATDEAIRRLELEVAAPVPQAYAAFLREANGSAALDFEFPLTDGDAANIEGLDFIAKDGRLTSLVGDWRRHLPSHTLPIGHTGLGDVFLLQLEPDSQAICLWRHHRSHVEHLADSFFDFWTGLVAQSQAD